jgi:carbonic anhydrase
VKPDEKPQNGLAGLKYWRYDLLAGLQVALVSLPLSLGIAIASGAPPVTGLVSSIIAGLVFPFLGGAYVTISGPAAGLAPALFAGMLLLGDGDLAAGYPLLLVAIFLTGLVMILLSWLRAGKLVAMFLPVTVVEAMLAAIGLMIIIKQVPALLGDFAPPAKTMLESDRQPAGKLPERGSGRAGHRCAVPVPDVLSQPYTACLAASRSSAPVGMRVGILLGYLFGLDAAYLIACPKTSSKGASPCRPSIRCWPVPSCGPASSWW